jgi:hypothetical protein
LCQLNPFCIFTPCFHGIHFNILLLFMPVILMFLSFEILCPNFVCLFYHQFLDYGHPSHYLANVSSEWLYLKPF